MIDDLPDLGPIKEKKNIRKRGSHGSLARRFCRPFLENDKQKKIRLLADCIDLDLGMKNGAISDDEVTASSVQSASTPGKNGRLNYASGSSWCAGTSDTNPYLQIDLQTLHIICAVSTQGNSQADQWVKNYTLQLSTDGTTWTDYREGGKVKTFQGNDDKISEVKHVLYVTVEAKFLRLLPKAYHGSVCLRTELFGVKQKPVNIALGKATIQSSTFNNTQLGVSGVSGNAVDGNSNTVFRYGSCTHTWENNPSWWRVDLGSDKVAVSDIFIVNRFSTHTTVLARSENYKITLGDNSQVVNNTWCKGLYSFVNFTASAVCFTDPLTTGRYVEISTVKRQFLNLCEVEIYLRDNLAFRKQTEQSSVQYGGVSSRAVDGISNPSYNAGSCTHTGRDYNPWWRVDLGQVEPVSEIYLVNMIDKWFFRQNSFEIRVGTVSDNNGGIANPRCGDKQSYSLPRGKGVSFFCRPVLFGRYVTVRSLRTHHEYFTLCEVEVYSERRACQMQAIGVASTDTLPDASFSASSECSGFEAFKGRLNAYGGWLPSTNNKSDDYLQIDLQYEFLICAVATQGRSTYDDWTTEYKLQLSFDGSTFVTYKENNVDKIFSGNSGRHEIVKHIVRDVRARFIRFQPVKFERNKALRVEVYGVLMSKVPSQAPSNLTLSASSSTSIAVSWQLPPVCSRHGIIVGYKLFYKKKGFMGSMSVETINGGTTFSGDITGLDKYTEYEFQVLAFTSHGDGAKSSVVVERTMKDEPRGGPANVLSAEVNETTFNISWAPLSREQTNGDIILYNVKEELLSRGTSQKRSSLSSKTVNTTNTFILLNGLLLCSQYQVSVRAYTKVGPGPYGPPVELPRTADPGTPWGLSASNVGTTQVRLEWKEPKLTTKEGISYRVKYLGTKPYNESFREEGFQDVGSSTSYTMKGLVPGSIYEFQIIASSVCGLGVPKRFPDRVETEMTAPMAPFLIQWTNVEVSQLSVEIDLWPVEQRNGPISAYQVIVLKVCDCYQELSRDFHLKLKDLNRNNNTFCPFYVAAEIKNNRVHDNSWKFTVGDGKSYGAFVNKELTRGESYIVYQRALTNHNSQILEGEVSKIAMISVKPGPQFITQGTKEENSESQVLLAAVITLSFIVFLSLVLNGTLIWRLRQAESNKRTAIVDNGTPQVHPGVCQVSESGIYMELQPKPSDSQSREPPEYQSLQDRRVTPDYYNMGFLEGRSNDKGKVYENIE